MGISSDFKNFSQKIGHGAKALRHFCLNYRAVLLNFNSWKVMEIVVLKDTERQLKNKAIIK